MVGKPLSPSEKDVLDVKLIRSEPAQFHIHILVQLRWWIDQERQEDHKSRIEKRESCHDGSYERFHQPRLI
jgi:hypothetical protein